MIKSAENNYDVWVWVEQRKGIVQNVSLELLSKGRELADGLKSKLAAVIMGRAAGNTAAGLVECGADRVYYLESTKLSLYQGEVYVNILSELIEKYRPFIFLVGATAIGMDLAPRVAARVGTGLTAHCSDLQIQEYDSKSLLYASVPGFGGNMLVNIICPQRRPQMATVPAGVFNRPQRIKDRKGEIIEIVREIDDKELLTDTIEMVEEKESGAGIEEAENVVAVGWGYQSCGSLDLAKELAGALDAVIGGTRPAVDSGWIPEERMIGQSGKTVSPKLLISLGASGASHFTAGFTRAGIVLAIDKNPEAPIFQSADVGIVGDLNKVLPCLIEEIRKAKK